MMCSLMFIFASWASLWGDVPMLVIVGKITPGHAPLVVVPDGFFLCFFSNGTKEKPNLGIHLQQQPRTFLDNIVTGR